MSAELKQMEPISVVGIEHIGPYHEIGRAFDRLFGMAMQSNWPISGSLGIYYDDPREVPEQKLRSMACLIVPDVFEPTGTEVKKFVIDGGEYAVLRHVGPYSELGDTWMKFYSQELPELGMDDAGPPFERYVTNPMETKPEDTITDLCIPVKPRQQ